MSLTQQDLKRIEELFDIKLNIQLNNQTKNLQKEIRASEKRVRTEMKRLQVEVRQDINSLKIYLDTNLK